MKRGLRKSSLLRFVRTSVLTLHLVLLGYFAAKWQFPSREPDIKGMAQVDARFGEMRRAGHAISFGEIFERYPKPADEENAAIVITNVMRRLDPTALRKDYLHLPFVGEGDTPEGTNSFPSQELTGIANFFEKHLGALNEIRRALQSERARFLVSEEILPSTRLPHLSYVKNAGAMLALRSHYLTSSRDLNRSEVIDCIEDMFKLAALLEPEPLLIAQLVRIAIHRYAFQSIQFLIDRSELNREEMARLQTMVDESYQDKPWRGVLELEICSLKEVLLHRHDELLDWVMDSDMSPEERSARMREGKDRAVDEDAEWRKKVKRIAIASLAESGQLTDDVIVFTDYMTEYMEGMKAPYPDRLEIIEALNESILTEVKDPVEPLLTSFYPRMILSAVIGLIDRDVSILAYQRCMRVALAIESYRYVNLGELPERLSDLIPAHISEIPKDPYTGDELDYHIYSNRSGYKISSVGKNKGKDELHMYGGGPDDDAGFRISR